MGNIGVSELLVVLVGTILVWGVPMALVVWAARTLSAIRRTQAEILQRLATLEAPRRSE